MIRNASLVSAILWLATGLVAPSAIAQPADNDAKAAVDLAREAKAKYDQGQWRGALELFHGAEAKAHSPVLVLYAGRCHRNLGELVAAKQLYERVVAEPLGDKAPQPFLDAQKDAAADLEALAARIPTLVIDRSAVPTSWQITVDDVTARGGEVAVDPGKHLVRASDGTRVAFEREVMAAEGGRITVRIEPSKNEAAPAPVPGAPAAGATTDGGEGGFGTSIGPGLLTLGLGAAGVGVGVGLRVAALSQVSAVKDRCVGTQCLAEDAAEVDSAETLQTVSTVLFSVGGAAMATGIVLLIVLPEDTPAEQAAPSVSLDLRPGWLGLRGTF
jgi:hypothetical protein